MTYDATALSRSNVSALHFHSRLAMLDSMCSVLYFLIPCCLISADGLDRIVGPAGRSNFARVGAFTKATPPVSKDFALFCDVKVLSLGAWCEHIEPRHAKRGREYGLNSCVVKPKRFSAFGHDRLTAIKCLQVAVASLYQQHVLLQV
jgi:hypothetical protein